MTEEHITFSEKDTAYHGIPTGIRPDRPSTLKLLSDLRDFAGWKVGEKTLGEWHFSGFTRRENQVYVYGPAVSGRDLGTVMALPIEEALPLLLRLAEALLLLKERSIPPFALMLDSVVFTDDAEVLFFPPAFMERIKDSRSMDYRIDACELINHPYLQDEPLACFTLAALLYRLLSGAYPFSDTTEERIRARVRNLDVTPPHLLNPEVKEQVSGRIMRALKKPEGCTLEEWAEDLETWLREGITHEISTSRRELLEKRAKTQTVKADRSLKRKVFFERHGRTVTVTALAVIVAGAVLGSILKNLLEPRATEGFTPAQVVELFYTSINSLDHMMMEDAVVEKAGKSEINEATSLFVLDRQAQAYEGKSYRVPADEWAAEDRPDLPQPYYVHGVANLRWVQEDGGEVPVFKVDYEKWGRRDVEDSASGLFYEGYDVTDRVFLKRLRKYWVIYRIDRLDSRLIRTED